MRICTYAALLALACMAAGARADLEFPAQMDVSLGGGNTRYIVTLQSDGSWHEVLTRGDGSTEKHDGTWKRSDMSGLPGMPSGRFIELTGFVDPSSHATSGVPATTLYEESSFQPSPEAIQQRASNAKTMGGFLVLLAFGAFVLWIWALVNALQAPFPTDGVRIGWVLCIVLLGALGALLYLVAGRPSQTTGGSINPS